MKKYLGTALFVAVAASSLVLDSCNYDNREELFPVVVDTGVVDTTVTFADDIQPLIMNSCATSPGCHATGSNNPVLMSYEEISGLQARIQARAIDAKTMPPGGSLPQDKIDELQQWIDEGAQNN
jgi:uncharacterized membrane protein